MFFKKKEDDLPEKCILQKGQWMFVDIQKSTSCPKQRSWNKPSKEGEIYLHKWL